MWTDFLAVSGAVFAATAAVAFLWHPILWSLLATGPLFLLGLADMFQSKQTIRRNYPLVGRGRYWMEVLRPKIYQYFIESDINGRPFSRFQRSVIYQRAKKELETTPFGTQLDVNAVGYEWISHSIAPISDVDRSPRVKIGGKDCKKPYSASIFNISAMSFGSLGQNAILALNAGAKRGGFYHNTGEGGVSRYHLEPGGDVVWQVGTGYFGARAKDGTFSAEAFAKTAAAETIRMVELKLSQGAKPGHGGILPGVKNTPEIAAARGVEPYTTVHSPPAHTAFSTPRGLLEFLAKLRELSGGKPVGFKLCVGHPTEFAAICKAMLATKILPDFITVDGGEGGTGAAPLEFSNGVGMPLTDGLVLVDDYLRGFGLRDDIVVIASGKIVTGFDIVRTLALGADVCNSARGMMFALGCIQALTCNTNECPTGITTQDPARQRGLVVADKQVRVANFHEGTVHTAAEILGAAALRTPEQVKRQHIRRRVSPTEVKRFDQIYPIVEVGSMPGKDCPERYARAVEVAHPDHFYEGQ